VGCVTAIVAADATIYIVALLMSPWPTPTPGSTNSGPTDFARISAIMYAIYSIPVAILASLILAVPLFGYMHNRGMRSIGSFLGAGAFISASTGAASAVANQYMALLTSREFALALLSMFVAGPIGAITVRAITYRSAMSRPISSS
jgi:hypothetical protein